MKKTLLFISFFVILFSACEKDDFCVQNPVTPQLVLSFYNNTNRETLKSAQRLSVWAEGKDTLETYISQRKDSIFIPLNTLATQTIYHLKINNIDGKKVNNKIATLTINYTPQEEYVSRSCGYKVIFNDVSFSTDNSWILDFTPTTLTTIDNQDEAHVQIFH
ncbi:MAG: DUF6452 family protein [Polaribacter sp.]|uniref:DUF6452 family protein n=1 Tax=Polaribacter sp. TaxID=1920175 RepID=UPI002F35A9D9